MTTQGRLVFDVGGTQLRGAVYDEEAGALAAFRAVEAPSYVRHPDLDGPALRAHLATAMTALRATLDPAGAIRSATVAFPGPLDVERRVLAAPTLWGNVDPGGYPYPLEHVLERAWPGVVVRVLNDVTAAGYRYMRGTADELCVLTVSTGIGNKVFVGGRPLLGPAGAGGEIGHLQVDASASAPPCDCGGRGHVGALASGRGVLARARLRAEADGRSGHDGSRNEPARPAFGDSVLAQGMGLTPATLTAEALAEAYRKDDRWTAALVDEAAGALGTALAAIHLSIGVDRFVMIGGFAFGLGERFREALQATIDARCWRGSASGASVTLGSDDGLCALLGGGRAQALGLVG